MAIILFLLGSILGLTGTLIQFVIGADLLTCLMTYGFFSMALPLVTIFALALRHEG